MIATIGIDFKIKTILMDGRRVKLQVAFLVISSLFLLSSRRSGTLRAKSDFVCPLFLVEEITNFLLM